MSSSHSPLEVLVLHSAHFYQVKVVDGQRDTVVHI